MKFRMKDLTKNPRGKSHAQDSSLVIFVLFVANLSNPRFVSLRASHSAPFLTSSLRGLQITGFVACKNTFPPDEQGSGGDCEKRDLPEQGVAELVADWIVGK